MASSALIVSYVVLAVVLVLLVMYLAFRFKLMTKPNFISKILLYLLSLIALASFIYYNTKFMLKFIDLYAFFISPFTILYIGWRFACYFNSLFTLLFMGLNLAAGIICLIDKLDSVFLIVSFVFVGLHIMQLISEFKVNEKLRESRSSAGYYNSFVYVSYVLCFLGGSDEWRYYISYYSPIPYILFNGFILLCKRVSYDYTLITGTCGGIIVARTIHHSVGVVFLVLNMIYYFGIDLLKMNDIYEELIDDGDKYEKLLRKRAKLVEKGNENHTIKAKVFLNDEEHDVVDFDPECLANYDLEMLVFENNPKLYKFELFKYQATITKVVFNSYSIPELSNINKSMKKLSIIELNSKNKSIFIIGGIIYKNFPPSILIVSKATKFLLIRESIQFVEPWCCARSENLRAIKFPVSLKKINEFSFTDCRNLETINFVNTRLRSIERSAFSYCVSLKSLKFPVSVRKIENFAFFKCENVSKIIFPEKCKLRHIGKETFAGTSIKSIIFPNKLKEIGERAFSSCTHLNSLTFSEGTNNLNIEEEAFHSCRELQVHVPSSWESFAKVFKTKLCKSFVIINRAYEIIDQDAFKKSLYKTIYIPPTIKRIEKRAFADCKNLVKVVFCDNSRIEYIHPLAFKGSAAIKKITYEDENVFNALKTISHFLPVKLEEVLEL